MSLSLHLLRRWRAPAPMLAAAATAGFALASLPAQAQHEERFHEGPRLEGRHEGPAFRGDIGRFHEHDWAVWHSGRWMHASHGGRLGWWWVAGGIWYFYPYPVYPYPDPYLPPDYLPPPAQPGVVPPPQTPANWYYCNSARGYYPYVTACPEGWQSVPPGAAVPPAGGAVPPR